MRRWTILGFFLLTGMNSVALASDINTAIVNADRHLSVELGGLHQNYAETQGGTALDKEQGTMPDMGVEYSVLGLNRPFLFVLGGTLAGGHTAYTGALVNLATGATVPWDSSTRNRILDAHVGLGYAFGLGDLALIPGVIYGEHSWERDINYGASPGLQENYGNQYMAATLKAQFALGQSTVVSLSGAYGTTMNATMSSSSIGNFALTDKPWVHAGFAVDFAAYSDLHIGMKLDYTQFKYGASANFINNPYNVNLPLVEPFSKSTQTVFNLTMGYNF